VSDIYSAKGEYDIAVKYLESAYYKDYSEKILDRMSIILYVNLKRQKDAIAQLETHTRIHGCSIEICKRLIAFYGNENNTKGFLSAYLRYYQLDPSEEIAKQIAQIYMMEKDYNKLMLFLEESGIDDKTLLRLYLSNKNYTKAAPLAKKIYDENGEVQFLGESIIYEYEAQKEKDKKFLQEISLKFEELLVLESSGLFLNYYGYILIDHDVDPKKGIEYIKQALKQEPNSMYYLDSLAWGYYKLKECDKAMSTIKKVMKLDGGDDPEVIKHYKAIQQCKGEKN
jgi:tetratricopeptide (TPR) repeat protein